VHGSRLRFGAQVTAIANTHAQTYRGKVDYIYETALKGYAIELPNEAAAIAISNLPQVKWVEEDALGEPDQALAWENNETRFTRAFDTVPVKSFELPGPHTKQEAVCRGKSIPVSLTEPLFGVKMHGRRCGAS
jgi:fibronectin type 3 domain-containing protein